MGTQQPRQTRPYAIIVPVGPQALEVERLQDLVASIMAYEPEGLTLVLVDDSTEPRDLANQLALPSSVRAVSLHLKRPFRPEFKSKGVAGAVFTAIKWVQANTDADFAIKLDTDSLVIGDFIARISAKLEEDASLAKIGAYSLAPDGKTRDWTVHEPHLRQLNKRIALRRPWKTWAILRDPFLRHFRRLYGTAQSNGYRDGEHCLGGGYAISRAFMDRLAARGYLDDIGIWVNADMPEDVAVGIHVRAVGMQFSNFVGEGEVFGVKHRGLPFPLADLQPRGFGIIHAVKNDPDYSEDEIRLYYRERRTPRAEATA
jgi:hypothetical protein